MTTHQFSSCGKEVLDGRTHYADSASEASARRIALALNIADQAAFVGRDMADLVQDYDREFGGVVD